MCAECLGAGTDWHVDVRLPSRARSAGSDEPVPIDACVRACVRLRVYVGVRARLPAWVLASACAPVVIYKCVRAPTHVRVRSFVYVRACVRVNARVSVCLSAVLREWRAWVRMAWVRMLHALSTNASAALCRRRRERSSTCQSSMDRRPRSVCTRPSHSRPPQPPARRAGRMTGTTSAQDCRVLPVAVCCVSSCSHAPRSQPNRSERRPLSRRIGVLAHDSQPPRRRLRDRACAATGSMSCHTQHTVHDAGPPRD